MRFLPLIALFSILSVIQARDSIRRQIRKRGTVSDGLDAFGLVRTAGSGSFGIVSQSFHTFNNILDKMDTAKTAVTAAGQVAPANVQTAPTGSLDSAETGNTAATTAVTGKGAVPGNTGKTGSLAARDSNGKVKKNAVYSPSERDGLAGVAKGAKVI